MFFLMLLLLILRTLFLMRVHTLETLTSLILIIVIQKVSVVTLLYVLSSCRVIKNIIMAYKTLNNNLCYTIVRHLADENYRAVAYCLFNRHTELTDCVLHKLLCIIYSFDPYFEHIHRVIQDERLYNIQGTLSALFDKFYLDIEKGGVNNED